MDSPSPFARQPGSCLLQNGQIPGAPLSHAQVEAGYAGLKDVTADPPANDNTMQSFWLAETLKYAWLMFAPGDVIDLDEWVLNTEAHPLRIMQQLPEFLAAPVQDVADPASLKKQSRPRVHEAEEETD